MSSDRYQDTREGYYGPDGEFYPASSQSSKAYSDNETLYPKRPSIQYTTEPYPGTELPSVQESDPEPVGYTGQMKFCKYCGKQIPEPAVICSHCGCQVDEIKQAPIQGTVITNNTTNYNTTYSNTAYTAVSLGGKPKNKWVSFFLCLFGGGFGLHRFYEGKIRSGLLWLFTGGLFGVGTIVDLILILLKSNPYYV